MPLLLLLVSLRILLCVAALMPRVIPALGAVERIISKEKKARLIIGDLIWKDPLTELPSNAVRELTDNQTFQIRTSVIRI